MQQLADVLDSAHAATHRERHEAALRRALDDGEDGVAVLVAGRDVEEAQLVGAGLIVGRGRLDGIAGVLEVDEVDALDDAPVLDVEAGDEADLEHGQAGVGASGMPRKTAAMVISMPRPPSGIPPSRPASSVGSLGHAPSPCRDQTHARGSSWLQMR